MVISLKILSENLDGSANAICNYDDEGEQFLVQEGITAIIKQYIEQQKKEPNMSATWEVANRIDELSCRISNIANTIEVLATAETTEPTSGALWMVRDYLEILAGKFDEQSQNLMAIHRDNMAKENEVVAPIKKEKKK
jgi:hypothetical protein